MATNFQNLGVLKNAPPKALAEFEQYVLILASDAPIAEFTRNLIDYYPMASYIFKEDIDLKTGKRRRYSLPELIHLSQSERGKPLKSRDY